MTSDNHVTGPVSDAMLAAGVQALDRYYKSSLSAKAVSDIYLAMKSKEQASVHSPDEVERVARAIDELRVGATFVHSRDLARAAITALSSTDDRLRQALEAIANCRGPEGYGWNITALNKALNAALPLIGREPPPCPFPNKRALRKARAAIAAMGSQSTRDKEQ